MKWKKIGNFVGMVLGTAYLFAVLWLEETKKLDWKSLAGLVILFLIWGLMIFANLAAFFDNKEISFLGIKIASNKKAETETPSIDPNDFDKLQKRTEKLEKDVHDLKEKLDASNKEDFHKEFEQFRLSKPDLDVIMVEGYESPSRLTEFTNLVKRAKTNGYDLSSDTTYQGLTKVYRQHITDQLKTVLKTLDYSSEFSGRMQKLLENAMVSVPTNQEVIASIKKELISANENNKLEISDVFFKATNDLKKLKP